MEAFFEVVKGSELYKDYFDYLKNLSKISEVYSKFAKEHGDDGIIIIAARPRDSSDMKDGKDGDYGRASTVCCSGVEFIAQVAVLAEQTGIGCRDLGLFLIAIASDKKTSDGLKAYDAETKKHAFDNMTPSEKTDFLIAELGRKMAQN